MFKLLRVVLLDDLRNELALINHKLNKILKMEKQEMALIDDVVTKVEAQTTVVDSAVALLVQLKAMLDAAGTDPVKLAAISDLITVNSTKLADAVVANTPAAP